MKNILMIIILIIGLGLTGCYSRQHPNGDGTMTVVEYNIFKKDSVVLENVRCPINHRGTTRSIRKGHHLVGIIGRGGHYVPHYDIEVIWTNHRGESKLYEGRVYSSEYNKYRKKGYFIIQERFYPYYEIRLKL